MDYPLGIPPLFINSFCRYTAGLDTGSVANPTSALTWTANKAIYIPFYLPWEYPVRRVFWANGTSVASTSMDFGIYNADGTKIYSTGSTGASGTSVLQYVTPTEFTLSAGRYYMAYACSTSTAARGGTGASALNLARQQLAGILEQATALPLPATMTPVTLVLVVHPLCGFTRTLTGF